jgi:hypothetical protein
MNHVINAGRELGADGWHKPFAMRQSTDPEGPALVFTETELDVFAAGWTPHKAGLR